VFVHVFQVRQGSSLPFRARSSSRETITISHATVKLENSVDPEWHRSDRRDLLAADVFRNESSKSCFVGNVARLRVAGTHLTA